MFPSNGKHGGVNVKVDDAQKHDGYSTRLLTVGKSKIKVYCISGWSVEKEPPKDFVNVHEKISNAISLDNKSTLMLVCKDGCSRSGIYCLLDIESERYRKKGRIKLGESIKTIRFQRSNCFDTQELFEAGAGIIMEFAKKAQEKENTTKTS
ncbi:Protein-tyrosine phosphatase [Oesophagostomum dentatum]|uniref:Protein-tyrosine phosphatase n=1 Tax=Oesophagostomum dentatum TaxID=61180 RepID=A0A0B1TLT9_OESDE|nr:Protein-tyrosine phosphatase [Oesophagostomum dentatum]